MNITEQQDTSSGDNELDAQQDIIQAIINAIVNAIRTAMRDIGLTFPVYITVRNSGDALVTIAAPLIRRMKNGSTLEQWSVGALKRSRTARSVRGREFG